MPIDQQPPHRPFLKWRKFQIKAFDIPAVATVLVAVLLGFSGRWLSATPVGDSRGSFRGDCVAKPGCFLPLSRFECWSACYDGLDTHYWVPGYAAQVTAADGGGRQRKKRCQQSAVHYLSIFRQDPGNYLRKNEARCNRLFCTYKPLIGRYTLRRRAHARSCIVLHMGMIN